jgi:predicted RNase H-like HicB family nuclease
VAGFDGEDAWRQQRVDSSPGIVREAPAMILTDAGPNFRRSSRATMQIPILIEPIAGNGYRARGGEPLALTADGASQEEALANLKQKLEAKLCNGAVVVSLELPSQTHPLTEFAGMFKDDPLLKEWKKSMAAYRCKVDKHADKP